MLTSSETEAECEREACIRVLEDLRPRNDRSDWTEYAHDIDAILCRAIAGINARYDRSSMTIPPNPHPEQVEITQEDRDAALSAIADDGTHSSYMMAEAISSGGADDWPLVQAFARYRLDLLANLPADDVCDLCNGHGYWETAPGTCSPGGERNPCGKCSSVTITMGGQTWSTNPAASGTNGTTKSEQPR